MTYIVFVLTTCSNSTFATDRYRQCVIESGRFRHNSSQLSQGRCYFAAGSKGRNGSCVGGR